MVTRRELGFLLLGGGGATTAAYAAATVGDPTGIASDIAGGDPMQQSFPLSSEFVEVRWRETAWIDIVTESDAEGMSIALAVGDVSDPMSADNVSSNITDRGATVEFGLAEAIRNREFEEVSIGSYRVQEKDGVRSAEKLDVITSGVPDAVLSRALGGE